MQRIRDLSKITYRHISPYNVMNLRGLLFETNKLKIDQKCGKKRVVNIRRI